MLYFFLVYSIVDKNGLYLAVWKSQRGGDIMGLLKSSIVD